MGKNSGKLVKCSDGRIGRTYNNEPFVNGKIQVHVFSEATQAKIESITQKQCLAAHDMRTGKPEEKRLCSPETLTVIGMAD